MLAAMAAFSINATANELEELLKEGLEVNPAVLAAKYQVEQTLLKHDELAEFFDPDFYAALGKAERARSVPNTTPGFTSLTNDSIDTQIGVQIPVMPGAYVTVGAAERLLQDVEGHGDIFQTLYGVRVRVPLLKDRAFKDLSLKRKLAMAEYTAAISNLLKVSQIMRRDIELAYISAYEKLSAYRVTQAATERFTNLHEEAKSLSKLKVVPEYQIFQSKLELQIGKEDEEKARVAFELSLTALADAVGIQRRLALAGDQQALLDAASKIQSLTIVTEADACESRGVYQQIKKNIEYAETQMQQAEEEKVDDLNFNFGITAQGEHEHHPFGMERIVTDRRVGTEVTLVWQRKIDYRGPNARISRFRARMKELNEELRQAQLDIRTAMLDAEMNFKAALTRLEIVNQGIEAAKETLAAEQERFRLGESTSSNVTDAQKNLTSILQRQTTATADLLRARANYMYATGYEQNLQHHEP